MNERCQTLYIKRMTMGSNTPVADPGGATGGHGPPNDGQIFFHT